VLRHSLGQAVISQSPDIEYWLVAAAALQQLTLITIPVISVPGNPGKKINYILPGLFGY